MTGYIDKSENIIPVEAASAPLTRRAARRNATLSLDQFLSAKGEPV
jgi:hypothetical protein